MSLITAVFFFTHGNVIYGYAQVVKAGPPTGGNTVITFADGSTVQVTNAEAKEIFGF